MKLLRSLRVELRKRLLIARHIERAIGLGEF